MSTNTALENDGIIIVNVFDDDHQTPAPTSILDRAIESFREAWEQGNFSSREYIYPDISDIADGKIRVDINDPGERLALNISSTFFKDTPANTKEEKEQERNTVLFFSFIADTYLPKSRPLFQRIAEFVNPDDKDSLLVKTAWTACNKMIEISKTLDHPDLYNLDRLNALYFKLSVLDNHKNQSSLKLVTEDFAKEIEDLENYPGNKENDSLKVSKFLFYIYTQDINKIIEDFDTCLNAITRLEDMSNAYLVAMVELRRNHRDDLCKKIFDVRFPDHNMAPQDPNVAIAAAVAGYPELCVSLFSAYGDDFIKEEYFPYLTWYITALYESKQYDTLISKAHKFYGICDKNWKEELLYLLENASCETGNFNTYNSLQLRFQEECEARMCVHPHDKKIFPEYFSEENRTKKSIVGITIDLKYSDADGVNICELNTLTSSGLEGYKAAYERDLRDSLKSFYEDQTIHMFPQDISRFDGQPRTIKAGYDLMLCENLNGFTVKNNASPSLNVRAGFKDITMLDSESLGFGDVFPEGVVLSKTRFRKELKEFMGKLDDTDLVILKPVNSSIGYGVTVLSKKDVLKTCARLFTRQDFISKDEDVWKYDIHSNFVIQKCAKSDPVLVRDGKEYDATMRYVVSMAVNHETGDVEIHPHGAYWKLPPKALSDVTTPDELRKVIVSQPPSELTEEERKRPFSEKVDDVTFAKVSTCLDGFLRGYAPVLAKSPEDFIKELKEVIQSPASSEQQKAVVIDVATNDQAGYVLEAYFRNRGQDTYVELVDTIERFAEKARKDSPAGDFARAVMGITKKTKSSKPQEQEIKTDLQVKRERFLQSSRNNYIKDRKRQNLSPLKITSAMARIIP